MRNKKAQSSMEFTILIIVILGALLCMQVYFKRGLQGRWRSSIDDVGEQYDPTALNGDVTSHLSGTTITKITTTPDGLGGIWTTRQDQSNTLDSKSGTTRVASPP